MSAITRTEAPTAPGADKWAEYVAGLQRLNEKKRQRRRARHRRAHAAARAAAAVLRERFGATHVRVFGSVLNPQSFHLRSDIDLAVEGVDPMRVLKAWCAVSATVPEFDFDLVTPDECRPEIWASVEAEGVEL